MLVVEVIWYKRVTHIGSFSYDVHRWYPDIQERSGYYAGLMRNLERTT
jgi:hypothetical protein